MDPVSDRGRHGIINLNLYSVARPRPVTNGMDTARDTQRIRQLLVESSRICIVPGDEYPSDTLPAALGLAHTLKNLGKCTSIHYSHAIPTLLQFLPFDDYIEESPSFDCVVVIGAPTDDMAIYETHPLIIISTQHPEGGLGTATYIDTEASSCAELVTRLLKMTWEEHVSQEAATSLLTGIMSHTENFQHPRTRPQTLFAAAYLMGKDADRETIIKTLYKERPLDFIRLWGRALKNLEYDEEKEVAHSILTSDDFASTNTGPAMIPSIVRELVSSVPQAQFVVLAWDSPVGPYCGIIIRAAEEARIVRFADLLGGTRKKNNLITTVSTSDAREAVATILHMIK